DRAGRQEKGTTQQSTVDSSAVGGEVVFGPEDQGTTQQSTVDSSAVGGEVVFGPEDQGTASPRWPQALRRVRAWLGIARMLARIWRGWSDEPPPAPLLAVLSAAAAG